MRNLLALAALLVIGSAASAADPIASPEFARIKALVGTWEGKAPDGKPVTLIYTSTAGGTAICERIYAGDPHEMTTVYYERGGKLMLTHYCLMGNQPVMKLASSDATTMKLSLVDGSLDSPKDMHMHALAIEQADANTLKQTWTLWNEGAETGAHVFTYARKQ